MSEQQYLSEPNTVEYLIENSFLREFLQDEDITDINFDSKHITIKHNKKGTIVTDKEVPIQEVKNLFKQISDIQNKEFTYNTPVLDTSSGNYRINAVHERVSPDGMTFSIRVSRSRLVLRDTGDSIGTDDEDLRADIETLLRVFVEAGMNILIGGETGSGKTELQKTLIQHIHNKEIVLIEDTQDSHIKSLYEDKPIKSYLVPEDKGNSERTALTIRDMVRVGLRNFPDWLIVSETRGKESSDMLDAAKTNHRIITTLHSSGAKDNATRLMPMIRQSSNYKNMSDRQLGKEIVKYFPVNIHLHLYEDPQVRREIQEIVILTDYEEEAIGVYLYKKTMEYSDTGEYKFKEETGKLPQQIINKLMFEKKIHDVPERFL